MNAALSVLESSTVRIDGGDVARVTLRGATRLNVVDEPTLRAATAAMREILDNRALRCVCLSGASPAAFVGGANLHALRALTADTAESFIRAVHDFCLVLRTAQVPVIAVLRGFCLGAGLEIAAACDMRVGDRSVRCGMPEVRVGVPSVVEAALLPALIGWGRTRELLMRGHIVDATEAYRIGLLEHVVEAPDLDPLVETIARDFVAAGPVAMAIQKRLISTWEDSTMSAAIEHGVHAFVEACRTDERERLIGRFFASRNGRGDVGAS